MANYFNFRFYSIISLPCIAGLYLYAFAVTCARLAFVPQLRDRTIN